MVTGTNELKVRVGGTYKTRGYADKDLFGYVPGQKTVTIVANSDGWCDHLPYAAVGKHGYKEFTVDEKGRVYPPNYHTDWPGQESPYDLIEEGE